MLALGEAVYELAVAGELGDLEDFPEITACLVELEEIEEEISMALERTQREAAGMPSRPSPRPRRAGRAPAARNTKQDDSFRVWRPSMPEDPVDDEPVAEDAPEPSPEPPAKKSMRKPQRKAARSARASRSGGGIAFVADAHVANDDADLEEYMHEDDVPNDDEG